LFVAADIDDDTRQQLLTIREHVERTFARARKPPRLTWVDPARAHVTVRFVGEVSEATAGDLQVAMRDPVGVPPFVARWNAVGTFPGGRLPRVVWLGATAGQEEFARLAAAVDRRLAAVIGPGESRPFKAHVTVARVRDPGTGVDWRRAVAGVSVPDTATTVDHLTLYQSTLSPKGPTYHPLYIWTL
jgi:2'-5' RNA ligase